MKILLVGEYSNVHWTLAEGLRALGHEVTVVSDGDRWKDYPRDISIVRHGRSFISGVKYLMRLAQVWPRLRGYDVVQLINPVFLDLKAERIMPFYRRLRRNNDMVFMGAVRFTVMFSLRNRSDASFFIRASSTMPRGVSG